MIKTPLDSWILRKIGNDGRDDPLTPGRIRAYQLEKLREVIDYARKRSPFYMRSYDRFPRGAISSLGDMERIPFTTAEDVRTDPSRFLAVSQDDIARIVTLRTSGTTGDSKRCFFTRDDLELTIDFFCYGMSTLVKPFQKVLILLPGDRPDSVGDLLARGLKRMDVEGIVHGPVRDAGAAVEDIVRHRVDCLVGIPTQVLTIARSAAGSSIGKGVIKTVLLTTDYVPAAMVSGLERAWGCRVFNHYGMTETGLGGGVDCEAHDGYHLREADLYFEVIDPKTGEILPDGETGEAVFTTLTRKGMPLIRYRTGDIARFIPEPCPCGSRLRRLDTVKGRWDGMVDLTPQIVLTQWEMDEALFPLPGLLNYRAMLETEGGKPRLEIAVYGEWEEKPESGAVLKALGEVRAIRDAVHGGHLALSPVRFADEDWFTTGTAKRKIIDQRHRKG